MSSSSLTAAEKPSQRHAKIPKTRERRSKVKYAIFFIAYSSRHNACLNQRGQLRRNEKRARFIPRLVEGVVMRSFLAFLGDAIFQFRNLVGSNIHVFKHCNEEIINGTCFRLVNINLDFMSTYVPYKS
jgi:hypothetical protein